MKAKFKIQVGDTVHVTTGKDKNKQGKVLKIDKVANTAIVEGVNVATKHQKPVAGNPGEIKQIEMPIHISNIMLYCPDTKKPTKVGYEIKEGKKIRISKQSGKAIAIKK